MDAVKYLKTKARMTEKCCKICNECKLNNKNNGKNVYCTSLEYNYPEEAVKIAEEWDKEHPVKTCAQVFFERFPDAKKYENSETPMICVKTVGLSDIGHICPLGDFIDCCKCWNAPAPDKYQDWIKGE